MDVGARTARCQIRFVLAATRAVAAGLAPLIVAATASANEVPLPQPRPSIAAAGATTAAPAAPVARPSDAPTKPTGIVLGTDPAVLKTALTLAQQGKSDAATAAKEKISDPLAAKLVEWAILRADNGNLPFVRYATFIAASPSWPSVGLFWRRAEDALWHERAPAETVLAYFAKAKPRGAKGHLAYARALLERGDQRAAQTYVRAAWRNFDFSTELETQTLALFGSLLGTADHKARMESRFHAGDIPAGLRAAERAGGTAVAIAKAWSAVSRRSSTAKGLLNAVPAAAREDTGYQFARIQWLRRTDQDVEAAKLLLSAPTDRALIGDPNDWWIERRLVARALLDRKDPKTAYLVVRNATLPDNDNYRAEQQFLSGWIALRFLGDPGTALEHFRHIADGNSDPITRARAGYWQGRAAEALARHDEARILYQAAARYPTAYYGQLARARLGIREMALPPPPAPAAQRAAVLAKHELVRTIEALYAIGEQGLAVPMLVDLADDATDVELLAAVAEIAARYQDARGTLLVGKRALGRGLPFEHYAFPTNGIPSFRRIGPEVEASIVHAVARQESSFHTSVVSHARALGLMQVIPSTGRLVARKFGVAYSSKRMQTDPAYNVQIGAAELGDLIETYDGSYILALVGYNAGRGRVRQWLEQYGDPRSPKVDPIDWVERVPFSETRNYIQRVLENVQVYRAQLRTGVPLMIEADLQRGTAAN